MAGLDPSELEALSKVAASAEDLAAQVEAVQLAALRNTVSRDEAVERGRVLGEDEARRRGEAGVDRAQRVARAKAYAAWEYDGKPAGGSHLREMGVAQQSDNLVGLSGPDWKKGKK